MPKDRDEDLPSTLQKSPAKANWEPKGRKGPSDRGALGGTVEHRS